MLELVGHLYPEKESEAVKYFDQLCDVCTKRTDILARRLDILKQMEDVLSAPFPNMQKVEELNQSLEAMRDSLNI